MLDETDLSILELLAGDARRPYAEIAEAVGLSGPAVSDRVSRLEEAGVIEGFTVHLDRSQLRAGVPVLVRAEAEPGAVEDLRDRVAEADAVEHVFVTADGAVVFHARAETGRVGSWLSGLLGESVVAVDVELLDAVEWTPTLSGVEFALTCVECGNTVDSEGESRRIDGEVYHFCCPSCASRFAERHERLESAA